jgi:hypothetical protein
VLGKSKLQHSAPRRRRHRTQALLWRRNHGNSSTVTLPWMRRQWIPPKTVSPELLAHPLPKSSLSYADAAASPVPPPLDPLSTPKPTRKQLLPFLRVRINANNTIQLRD